MKKDLLRGLLASVPLSVLAWGAAHAQGAPGNTLQEVVVTAQKRDQRLQDVPVAVTALTQETLQANRINNVRDLDGIAPNLTVRTIPSGSSTPTFSMRGLVSAGTAPGADRGIAVYIDGVYIGAGSGAIFDLADIQRIEVLKGPQGTLFGRNSTGGAISFTTRNPSGEFGVRQELSYGNYQQFRSRTRIETPQWGPLSAILNYTYTERQGDQKNLGAGTVWDFSQVTGGKVGKLVAADRLGDNQTNAFSGAVKFDVSPDIDFVYKFDFTRSILTPGGIGLAALNPSLLGPPGSPGYNLVAGYLLTPNGTKPSTHRVDAVNNWFSVRSTNRTVGHNLIGRWQINDNWSLKNTLSARKLEYINPASDLSGMGGFLVAPGVPFQYTVVTSSGIDKQWSDELQVNYTSDRLNVTAGYLHYEQRVSKGGWEAAGNVYNFTAMPGFVVPLIDVDPGPGVNPQPSLWSNVTIRSDAVYAQGEYDLTNQITLVLGARTTHDTKNGIDNTVPGVPSKIAYNVNRPSYMAGVNYKPTDDILTYAKYSTGYISGGQLATLIYNAETAESWELGLKADWLDRTLRTNLALFHVDYSNQQMPCAGSVCGVPLAAQVFINAGDSRAQGFELETTYAPTRNLVLNAGLGYTDFVYKRLDPRLALTNNTLPQFRPKWTSNLSGTWTSDEFLGGLNVVVRADALFKSKNFASTGPANVPAIVDAITVPASWTVNTRAALRGWTVGRRTKGEIAVWARNIFDNDHMSYAGNVGYAVETDYERAPTFGVDVTFEY